MPNREKRLQDGLEECRKITRRYGTSFYFATQFFSKEVREGIYAVYAFARIPDEIVDDPLLTDDKLAVAKLNDWRDEWLEAMQSGRGKTDVMDAIVNTFRKYQIPIDHGEAFLRSMFLDKEKSRYQNYAELEDYMYGSAGVIGLMVTRIVGYSSDAAFEYAEKLGYAFQLTNFLRDVQQDCDDLGRIYLPQDELRRFDLSDTDIENHTFDARFVEFMKFQIQRNRKIYSDARDGISLLRWRGRLAIRIAYVLYKAILREIERKNYNVYAGRVRTNFPQKLWLSTKSLAGIYE